VAPSLFALFEWRDDLWRSLRKFARNLSRSLTALSKRLGLLYSKSSFKNGLAAGRNKKRKRKPKNWEEESTDPGKEVIAMRFIEWKISEGHILYEIGSESLTAEELLVHVVRSQTAARSYNSPIAWFKRPNFSALTS
jgi:hypothetical protein